MNYLGIDLGTKRCGLAYSFESIIFTLPAVSRVDLMKNIKKILKEKNIEEIIIGAPYDLYGKDLRQLDRTKKFVEKIKNIFPEISIKLEDERFTTFESLNILNMQGFSKKEISEKKDSMSAYLILESYLKRN